MEKEIIINQWLEGAWKLCWSLDQHTACGWKRSLHAKCLRRKWCPNASIYLKANVIMQSAMTFPSHILTHFLKGRISRAWQRSQHRSRLNSFVNWNWILPAVSLPCHSWLQKDWWCFEQSQSDFFQVEEAAVLHAVFSLQRTSTIKKINKKTTDE